MFSVSHVGILEVSNLNIYSAHLLLPGTFPNFSRQKCPGHTCLSSFGDQSSWVCTYPLLSGLDFSSSLTTISTGMNQEPVLVCVRLRLIVERPECHVPTVLHACCLSVEVSQIPFINLCIHVTWPSPVSSWVYTLLTSSFTSTSPVPRCCDLVDRSRKQ
jgi:hypothetical protein